MSDERNKTDMEVLAEWFNKFKKYYKENKWWFWFVLIISIFYLLRIAYRSFS